MSKWIEIPSHRIYAVSYAEFHEPGAYRRVGVNGGDPDEGEMPAFIVRCRDGKRFKQARFLPSAEVARNAEMYINPEIYLEEL